MDAVELAISGLLERALFRLDVTAVCLDINVYNLNRKALEQ